MTFRLCTRRGEPPINLGNPFPGGSREGRRSACGGSSSGRSWFCPEAARAPPPRRDGEGEALRSGEEAQEREAHAGVEREADVCPVRGTSSAVTLRVPWLAGGSHRGTRHRAPPYGESKPLLKCSWNWFLPTRGGDPSPEGARKPPRGCELSKQGSATGATKKTAAQTDRY